jgi:DNA-binding NtrC family response regulator
MAAPHVLVVDDEVDIRNTIQEILAEEGYDVAVAANAAEARKAVREQRPDLVLLDIWMPDTDGITLLAEWRQERRFDAPVVMLSGHGTVETAVEATRLGAADFVEKPLSLNKLLRTVEKALQGARSAGRPGTGMLPPIFAALSRSRRLAELREQATRMARHATPLLVIGEPGTGRGALARYVHDASERRDQPLVVAVGATLTAAAATDLLYGADTAQGVEAGLLEKAQGGTLFISSIEDTSAPAQALLASALEAGSFTPRGRAASQPVQARLMASVLPATVVAPQAAGVRPDLVQRLGALRIQLPPLRDYAEDISELLRYMAEDLADREQLGYRRFSVAAQNRLRHYPWPGNLTELRGLVRRLLVAGGGDEVSLAEVEHEIAPPTGAAEPLVKQDLLALPLREAREQFERAYLTEQLALCGGKVGALARRVGMERTHLYRKLRALGVDFRGTLGEDQDA